MHRFDLLSHGLPTLVVLVSAAAAHAQLAVPGSTYTVECVNCNPGGFTPTPVNLDGTDDLINSGATLVGETTTVTSTGEWLEIWLEQTGGGPLAANLTTGWSVEFDSVDFASPVSSPAVAGNIFVYFALNGVPQSMSPPSFGGTFGPHPTDSSVAQVYFPPANLITPLALSTAHRFGLGSDPYRFILDQLGVTTSVDEIHIGRFFEPVAPFLISPLASSGNPVNTRSPYTADVTAIFDHRYASQEVTEIPTQGEVFGPGTGFAISVSPDGAALAFTGEEADIEVLPPPPPSQYCYADNAQASLASEYVLYGNYSQSSNEEKVLCYDGHAGTDFATADGVTQVVAAASGVVLFRGCACGFTSFACLPIAPPVGCGDFLGTYVAIEHANGMITYYGHLDAIASDVVTGGTVQAGQLIGIAGATGNTGGGHLHFEVGLTADSVVDPFGFRDDGNLWLSPCNDGIDNDADGAVDFPADSDCTSSDDISETIDCADGVDNDLDRLVDYPDDLDCPDVTGVTEVPEPGVILSLGFGIGFLRFLELRRSASEARKSP